MQRRQASGACAAHVAAHVTDKHTHVIARPPEHQSLASLQESPASKADESTRDNFQKAIDLYEPIVTRMKDKGKLLDVAAIVVSNLCVAYIMNEKNAEAEELMKQLEREEDERAASEHGSCKPVRTVCVCLLYVQCRAVLMPDATPLPLERVSMLYRCSPFWLMKSVLKVGTVACAQAA